VRLGQEQNKKAFGKFLSLAASKWQWSIIAPLSLRVQKENCRRHQYTGKEL
jgi:hypothetical protein